MRYLLIWMAAASVLLLILMGMDKHRAKQGGRRVPECTLFLLAVLGGSLGGCLGMGLFRHKTQHPLFNWGFPILLVLQGAAAAVLAYEYLLP